ncbi:uncharacterized protein YndB with AHSA1/START domain [Kribbella antiqua]|uniref:Uncharacterized protein YndB with AHSA1/START domain n=1 Tax=Kribbella antiqua TaxID=2512217 RepID=A0A4R2I6Z0_9ACTN|nr:SRPBCC family protein [Kribbella antiqua]TCO38968.1 uncharacterized protein YndB with AHSA1/START domain [Kribbella antiqua]
MNRLGTLTIDGDRATMTFERYLPHPIERVWAALTEPSERKAWFGETVIDGGTIEMVPDEPPAAVDSKRLTGRILVWDPPYVLEHEWRQRIVEDSVVRYELRSSGDGTLLTFTHTGLSVANARGFIPGTHAFFDRLDAHLAGTHLPNWSERYAELASSYPSWS